MWNGEFVQVINWNGERTIEKPSNENLVHAYLIKKSQESRPSGCILLWKDKASADQFDPEKVFGGAVSVKPFQVNCGLTGNVFKTSGRPLQDAQSIYIISYRFIDSQKKLLDPNDTTKMEKTFKSTFPDGNSLPGKVFMRAFGKLPGMIVKIVSTNVATNNFAGIYLFTNHQDRDAYADGTNKVKPLGICPCIKMNFPEIMAKDYQSVFERFEVA